MAENTSNSRNQMPRNSPKLTPRNHSHTALNIPGYTAAGGWYSCRRSHNSSQLGAGWNGLAIIPHARLEQRHPPHRTEKAARAHGGRQRPPHAPSLPAARTHARRPAPDRIGSTGQPTPAALRALKTKTLGEATRPTRPRSLPAPARDPARSDRDPEFPELPFGQPALSRG